MLLGSRRRDAPTELHQYKSSNWGDGKEAPQRWCDALDAWHEEHGETVSVDPDSEWSDVLYTETNL